jgi:hypothetical protein
LHVLGGTHQFEAVQIRHPALAGHDIARVAELSTEVGVAGRDDAADQRSIVFVVQKRDDLLGHVTPGIGIEIRVWPVDLPTAVGGQDQHVRVIDLDTAVQWYPDGGHAELLHEAVGVLRNAGEVHHPHRGCPDRAAVGIHEGLGADGGGV